jgi:curved DNA-binding protein CbpA
MSHKPNYYKILGVPRDAPQEVVRAAYRRLAQKYHPDRHDGRDSADTMAFINSAYGVLSDPDARAQYDSAAQAPRNHRPAQAPHHSDEPESSKPWIILWAVVSIVVLALGWVAVKTLFPASPKPAAPRVVQQSPANGTPAAPRVPPAPAAR